MGGYVVSSEEVHIPAVAVATWRFFVQLSCFEGKGKLIDSMSAQTSQNTMAGEELESQPEKAEVSNEPTKKTRHSKFMSLWLGEWKEETRVPFWHEEFRETRVTVAKEWIKTSEGALSELEVLN